MSDYNKGVNDALMGAAIGDLSAGVGNALLGHFRNKRNQQVHNNSMEQIQRREDIIAGLKEANEINVKNGLKWKERALDAEVALDIVRNQSANRLVTLMDRTHALNKNMALAIALREAVEELFSEGKVINIDKDHFDHNVNKSYIRNRLKLDKATKEDFKDYGSQGQSWLPDEDYLKSDFQDFK